MNYCVWCFRDGKPGHENQTAGLLNALSERVKLDVHFLPAIPPLKALWYGLRGCFPLAGTFPDPDLIVGAGHATHFPMLAARRARGGKVVVLMKPSLPLSWFDLCIIPEHDVPQPADNVLVTQGVLSRIQYTKAHDDTVGLFLIGGPSSHVRWDNESVIRQVMAITQRSPDIHWWLTTSRRTPKEFIPMLAGLMGNHEEQLTVVPYTETKADWLPEKLGLASRVWVTEDSVSMVYEALGSGAALGLLSVPANNKRDRIAQGIKVLLQKDMLVSFSDWDQGRELKPPPVSFNEAARCADWMERKWLSDH